MTGLCVGAGGCVGAVLRYLLGSVITHEGFPLATFIINFMGSVAIGVVIAVGENTEAPANAIMFLKTGVCGGFTTFSTFSAEVLALLERKQYLTGGLYAAASVIICVAGVLLGKTLTHLILK